MTTYLITFLEGVLSFISPCILPMIPVYLLYFMGEGEEKKPPYKNALGFVLGFTLIFVALGAISGIVGGFFQEHRKAVDMICGILIVFLGLSFIGIFKLPFLTNNIHGGSKIQPKSFLTTVIFGMVFAFGWSPCVGPFLGSALLLGSQQGSVLEGVMLLFSYSMGLGLPFFLSALLMEQLKDAFAWIKRHYNSINKICGGLLVLLGLLMALGLLNKVL